MHTDVAVSLTGLYRDSWAIGTVTTSDFIGTPDKIGVCASSANASIDVYGTFQHWRRLS